MGKKRRQKGVAEARGFRTIGLLFEREKNFLIFIAIAFIVVGMTFENLFLARWIGFALAGYSAIANDSIQTIGTFIASNGDRKWWHLWLFIGAIFIGTIVFSWVIYNGDVSYQRLTTKGFAEPNEFQFLQVAAPIILLILTRLRMPVSTTFLLLSSFSTSPGAIESVIGKSMGGYVIAFVIALALWVVTAPMMQRWFKGKAHGSWTVIQWITSGTLWSVWIMQDAANIGIYLPRSLSIWELVAFTGYIFAGLGFLFYMKGDRIQAIVNEKSEVTDVRPATVIDFVYSIILIYHLLDSTVPMSTTWVFLGLLAGRELGMKLSKSVGKKRKLSVVMKMIGKDVGLALIGLLVSILLAIAVNPNLGFGIFKMFGF